MLQEKDPKNCLDRLKAIYNEETIQPDQITKTDFSQLFEILLYEYKHPKYNYEYTDCDYDFDSSMTKQQLSDGKNDVASRLEISQEMMRKIINWEKKSKNRDTIIAICMLLKAKDYEINIALRLHDLPSLDYSVLKEEKIRQISENYEESQPTIKSINERLRQVKAEPLDISRRGNKKTNRSSSEPQTTKTRIVQDESSVIWNQYKSLSTKYHPDRYDIYSSILIKDTENKHYYKFIAHTSGYKFRLKPNKKIDYSMFEFDEERLPKEIKNFDIKGKYRYTFVELKDSLLKKIRENLTCLNDTKNYGTRTSAKIINDQLHVFSESFNYTVPEWNNYYLTDYCNGEYITYKSNNSMFMYWYLNSDEYKRYYGAHSEKIMIDLNREISNSYNSSIDKATLNIEKTIFEQQTKEIDDLLNKLCAGKVFIRDINSIFEPPYEEYEIITYYGLQEKFECEYDNLKSNLVKKGKDIISVEIDKDKVDITINDICEGFKLGCDSIEEITRIKIKYGELNKIIASEKGLSH